MTAQLPSYDQITSLPAALDAVVTPDVIDTNGHMNVVHYLDWGSRAADVLVTGVGIDDEYRARRKLGIFTVEHHLVYYSELQAGDEFGVHARILDRGDKTVHLMTFLVDRTRRRLANTLELLLVHVDMVTRRAVAFPDDVAPAFDDALALSTEAGWDTPVCGAIRIRR